MDRMDASREGTKGVDKGRGSAPGAFAARVNIKRRGAGSDVHVGPGPEWKPGAALPSRGRLPQYSRRWGP